MNTLRNNLLPLSNCLQLEFRNFVYGTSCGKFVTEYPYARLLFSFGSRGETVLEDEAGAVAFRRGMWLLIPPFRRVRHFHAESTHLSIHFSFSVLRGAELLAGRPLLHGEAPELTSLAQSLIDPAAGTLTFLNGIQLLCRRVLFDALRDEFTELEQVYSRFVRYAALTDYLHRNLKFHTSVTEMAQVMNMGVQSFAKRFSADTGISPRKFFERILAEHAVRLLTGTDRSVKEIAAEMGFDNEYYFSRFFKRHLGLPPGEFRHRMTRIV